jgi:hypothetical protein
VGLEMAVARPGGSAQRPDEGIDVVHVVMVARLPWLTASKCSPARRTKSWQWKSAKRSA